VLVPTAGNRLSPALREYAETPDRFSVIAPNSSVERSATERVCLLQGPTWASVSGVHVAAGEVPSLLAEIRDRVPADREPVWWIGPSASPPDLYDQLRGRGLRDPRDRAPLTIAMVRTEPPAGPAGVDVRPVQSFEDFRDARQVTWDGFDLPEDRRARERDRLVADFAIYQRTQLPWQLLARIDGRPAGAAAAVPSARGVFLIGGATAIWARGRGVYRALVRARWDYAVERGTPTVVTHANPATSYPVLCRLGFTEVCRIRRLEDSLHRT
jgi:hypothetical protein